MWLIVNDFIWKSIKENILLVFEEVEKVFCIHFVHFGLLPVLMLGENQCIYECIGAHINQTSLSDSNEGVLFPSPL